MAREQHLAKAAQGITAWDEWRRTEPDTTPDLSNAELRGASLPGADLSFANLFAADLGEADLAAADFNSANLMYASLAGSDLTGADFRQANLFAADLRKAVLPGSRFSGAHAAGIKLKGADLQGANLFVADISRADLSSADLRRANFFGSLLFGTNLCGADCRDADLSGADLTGAMLADVDLSGATLSDCRIKGITASDLTLGGTVANDLVLTVEGEPEITVDTFRAASIVTAIINGDESGGDFPGGDPVMLVGRYPHERKGFLNGLRGEIRKAGGTPLLFDLEGVGDGDFTALVSRLAGRSLIVLVDLGGLGRPYRELSALMNESTVPVQPLLAGPADATATAVLDEQGGGQVHDLFQTDDPAAMIMAVGLKVIGPATGR